MGDPAALAVTPDKPSPSTGRQMFPQPGSHSSPPVRPCDPVLRLPAAREASRQQADDEDPGTTRSNEASPSFLPPINRAVARKSSKGRRRAPHTALLQDPASNALILSIDLVPVVYQLMCCGWARRRYWVLGPRPQMDSKNGLRPLPTSR